MGVTEQEKKMAGVSRRSQGVVTPPEGGWGWMIVAGCFLATICIRAVTRCVSMFFVEFQLHFEKDYSTTAWIHSLIDSITMLCAPLGGLLVSRFSCRAVVMLGGLLSSTGLVVSAFASSLEELYVFMGILTGLGFALSYTPAVAMVGTYFRERKALAYGIAMSGSGIGTFVLAPAVQMLIESYSWRGALLILGGFVSNLCVCGALMRTLKPTTEDKVFENSEANPEKDHKTETLDNKQVSSDRKEAEPKQQKMNNFTNTHRLLIANGALSNFELESDKLGPGTIPLLARRNSELERNRKIAECILFSNKLTETMLAGLQLPDPTVRNAGTCEELKMVESMNLNNMAEDKKIENSGVIDVKPTEKYGLDETVSPAPKTLVNPKTLLSRGRSLCLQFRQEFGFLQSREFLILSVSLLFLAYGCSAPVVYLVPYALSVRVPPKHAAFLMSIFGVSGIVGNITFGWITDRKCLQRYRMLCYLLAIFMEGLCCMFLPLLHSFSLLVPFSVLYGYFDGAYVALIPVVTSDVVGPAHLTSALGVVYFLHGIPYLLSPPIGGWLVDVTGNYTATFFLSGASFMFSALVLAAAMLVKQCWRSKSSTAAHSSPAHTAAVAEQGII